MAYFRAEVASSKGSRVITLCAESVAEAEAAFSAEGLLVSDVAEVKGSVRHRSLSDAERNGLLSRLAFLLSSGLGSSAALRTLSRHYEGAPRIACGKLLEQIEAGHTLAVAIERVGPPDFPEAVSALITAGYRAGKGAEAIAAAVAFEEDLQSMQGSAGNRLVSALIGFLFSALVVLGTIFYLAPRTLNSGIVQGGEASVGWALALGYVVMTCLAAPILFMVFQGMLRGLSPLRFAALASRTPVWRDLVLGKARHLAFYSLAALIRSGSALETCFALVAKTSPSPMVAAELTRAAELVTDGQPWAPAFGSIEGIERSAMLTATDKKQIAAVFERLSLRYKEAYRKSLVKAALGLEATAAVTLVMAGAVMFGLTILPMLQSASAIL